MWNYLKSYQNQCRIRTAGKGLRNLWNLLFLLLGPTMAHLRPSQRSLGISGEALKSFWRISWKFQKIKPESKLQEKASAIYGICCFGDLGRPWLIWDPLEDLWESLEKLWEASGESLEKLWEALGSRDKQKAAKCRKGKGKENMGKEGKGREKEGKGREKVGTDM